jgi:cytosine deaminase
VDLIIRRAKLRGQGQPRDIGVLDGKVAKIDEKITEKASQEIDAGGHLTTSSYVNPHLHLDKCLSRQWEKIPKPELGTEDIVSKEFSLKHSFTKLDIQSRALRAVDASMVYGTTAIRAFADVDTVGELTAIHSLVELKQKLNGLIDLQVVAFPQQGIIRDQGTEELLYKSMEAGADVVGSIPWYETTNENKRRHTDIVFEIATRYNKDIHSLSDDTDDPNSKCIEYTLKKTMNEKWNGRVSASHCRGALESPDDDYAKKIIGLAKEARISIVDNVPVCLMLYGRRDRFPIRRASTRVREFLTAGVNVTTGQDDIDDPYYPFGRGDMLEVGFFMAHSGHFGTVPEIEQVYDMITYNAAKALRLSDYGLEVGKKADLIILNAYTVVEAFRMQAERLYVIKEGRVVAETKVHHELKVPILG